MEKASQYNCDLSKVPIANLQRFYRSALKSENRLDVGACFLAKEYAGKFPY